MLGFNIINGEDQLNKKLTNWWDRRNPLPFYWKIVCVSLMLILRQTVAELFDLCWTNFYAEQYSVAGVIVEEVNLNARVEFRASDFWCEGIVRDERSSTMSKWCP